MNARTPLFLMIAAGALLQSGAARADSLTVRGEAVVSGDTVLLRDVADLDGPEAAALGDLVVGQVVNRDKPVTISLASIHALLDAKNVNWGKLSLKGYVDCQVRSGGGAAEPAEPPAAPPVKSLTPAVPGEAVANPAQPLDPSSAITLKDLVIAQLVRFSGVARDQLRFTFNPSDAQALGVGVLRDRFEFEPMASSAVGRVPVAVRQWHGQELVNTYRLSVDVARRCMAVVVTHEVSRDQVFAPGDLEMREVFLTDGRPPPLSDVAKPVGQICGSLLRAGASVYAADVLPPVLVKRGDIISVRTAVGGLMIKVPARAMEPGAAGQVIQVMNESSHEKYSVRVTGLKQAALASNDVPPAGAPAALPVAAPAREAHP